MTAISKLVWLVFALCGGVIRYHYGRRARPNRPIEEQDRIYEIALLTLSFAGFLGVPVLYLATPWLSFADYSFQPVMFCAGVLISAGSLWLFWRIGRAGARTLSVETRNYVTAVTALPPSI